jgi:hypothetical protein
MNKILVIVGICRGTNLVVVFMSALPRNMKAGASCGVAAVWYSGATDDGLVVWSCSFSAYHVSTLQNETGQGLLGDKCYYLTHNSGSRAAYSCFCF